MTGCRRSGSIFFEHLDAVNLQKLLLITKAFLKKCLVQNSKRRVLVADSSKYVKYSFFCASQFNELTDIVTDNNLNPAQRQEIQNRNFELVTV